LYLNKPEEFEKGYCSIRDLSRTQIIWALWLYKQTEKKNPTTHTIQRTKHPWKLP